MNYMNPLHVPSQADDQNSTSSAPAVGETWAERKTFLEMILEPLGREEVERQLRIHHEMFDRHAKPIPDAEERKKLFDEAYHATRPSERPRFVELARRSWT
jgi:hypothetical protein